MRLSTKLALLSTVLVAVVVGVIFAVLGARVRATTRRLYAEELSRMQRTVLGLQRDTRRQLLSAASLVAESPSLRSAIATYRVERRGQSVVRPDLTNTVQHELQRMARDMGRDLLATTDERGRVFAGYVAGATGVIATDLSTLGAIRHALDASATLDDDQYLAVLRLGESFYEVGVVPVILDGYTIGTVLLGNRLDAALVARLRASFDGEVIVSSAGQPIASTMTHTDAVSAITALTAKDSRSLRVADIEYVAASLEIGATQDGALVRLDLLRPLTPVVRRLTSAVATDFLVYGTLAVLLTALGAVLLSRSMLRPLHAFVQFMRAGAVSEEVSRVFDAEQASTEVRALNDSFGQLMTSLDRKRAELVQQSADLSAANAVLTDEIRERERVEQALRDSEAQLRQSQKLEAIGTLAGGIAHDFNNLLTVIMGYGQIASANLPSDSPAKEDLDQVIAAGRRAAALTHQLLAFSRKQVMQPCILDLGTVVEGVEPMLRRLIGENIELQVVLAQDLARIKADPGQLEQVLLNLVVNARDAMPGGGILTIATANGFQSAAGSPDGRASARVVTLTVRDTGTGIPADVRERIFEPFFTTKDPGKGTGLGLSTVYGIVQQSGGTLRVESMEGEGTTFTISLPVAVGQASVDIAAATDGEPPRGTETVLLVEDEEQVRILAQRTLEACGYTVVSARNGIEALDIARRMEGRIDALLTDIIMPQLSGPQLVERYLAAHAPTCVIYMSGYSDDAIVNYQLDRGHAFLRKPFTPFTLAQTVRDSLDVFGTVSYATQSNSS